MANAPPFADPDLRQRLIQYLTAVLPELGHKDRRPWAAAYVRGLLLEGERKSIEPMAKRLPDGNVQAMQHFIGKSPWPYEPVRRQLAQVLCADMGPGLWIIDDTGFPKQGKHSVGVARQYSGTLGKVANCQIAVSMHHATTLASVPIDWALYLPEAWAADPARCARAGVPAVSVVYRPKWQLALELIDDARQWELTDQRVVADAGYGNIAEFRAGLQERQLPYAVGVESGTGVWTRYPTGGGTRRRGAAGRARAGTMEAGARAARWTSRARCQRPPSLQWRGAQGARASCGRGLRGSASGRPMGFMRASRRRPNSGSSWSGPPMPPSPPSIGWSRGRDGCRCCNWCAGRRHAGALSKTMSN